MDSLTELADKLSFVVNSTKNDWETSEFTDDHEKLLMNTITTFIAYLKQYPSDYKLTCSDIVTGLDLEPHPEGGFYRRFGWTKEKSRTFYLLPNGSVSSWHRFKGIRETWKWLHGGTLFIPQISNNCGWFREVELAKDKDVVIMEEFDSPDKWGDWLGAYHKDDNFTFLICECTPPFEFTKFELANEQELIRFRATYPDRVEIMEKLSVKMLSSSS